jgi:hypothetical protein
MADINRSSIINNAAQDLALSSAVDETPRKLKGDVQPTWEMNPRASYIAKSAAGSATASVTVYTTPSDKDFFLTSIYVGVAKDIVQDGTSVSLQLNTVNGVAVYWYLPVTATLAQNVSMSLALPYPLKLDRASTIKIVGAFTAGTCNKSATITGYILE